MQSARYSVFAIALLAGASFAGCSGSPSVNHAAAAGATSVAGNAGLDGTIEPSLPASAGSGAQGGSLFVDLPETMAGSASVGGSTSQPYPDKLPDGFTAANMFGGFRVGEAIVAESGSPAETPSAGTERCGTTILAVIRDFKVDGENFGGKSIGDDKGLVEPRSVLIESPCSRIRGRRPRSPTPQSSTIGTARWTASTRRTSSSSGSARTLA